MVEIFGIPAAVLAGQILLGLINGSFYALLSLGLAIIFGMLNIINFAHGALYMLGGFVTWIVFYFFGIGYWPGLLVAPIVVGLVVAVSERLLLRHLYQVDHLYSLLFTFGAALALELLFRYFFC